MPLRSLLSKKKVLNELREYEALEATGQIDMDKLRDLEEAHISGKQDQSALIYALIVYGQTLSEKWFNDGHHS